MLVLPGTAAFEVVTDRVTEVAVEGAADAVTFSEVEFPELIVIGPGGEKPSRGRGGLWMLKVTESLPEPQ